MNSTPLLQSAKHFLKPTWSPRVEQLRFRDRPNLQRPLPLHQRRTRALRLCEPIYPEKAQICENVLKQQQIALKKEAESRFGFKDFLVNETRKKFYSHPMIAVYHENSYTMHDMLHMRGLVFDAKFPMELRYRQNSSVLKLALQDTKFQPVLRLCTSHTLLGFCQTTDMKKLLQVTKKMPKLILIGVITEGHLLHKQDIELYAEQTLESARSQLAYTLSAGSRNLSAALQGGISSLSQSLEVYFNNQKSEDKNSK